MPEFVDEVVATPDPPPQGVPNPIHDAEGADAAGYAGALVAGVRTYGWAAQTITRALGEQWLADGWVDYRLRRPLYAGEVLRTRVERQSHVWVVICEAGDATERRVVLDGTAGLGRASWLSELETPAPAPGLPVADHLPGYTLANVPLPQPLRPLAGFLSGAGARNLVSDDLGLTDPRYLAEGDPVPVHPYFLAGRMAPLTRHNFTYGPTIHVRSQIQHLRTAQADQEIVVGAQIVDAYDRNEHWYQVLDGVLTDPGGEIARIRHHTIFRPRGT